MSGVRPRWAAFWARSSRKERKFWDLKACHWAKSCMEMTATQSRLCRLMITGACWARSKRDPKWFCASREDIMSVMMNITVYGIIVYKCSDNRDFCQDFDPCPKTSPPQKIFWVWRGNVIFVIAVLRNYSVIVIIHNDHSNQSRKREIYEKTNCHTG